MYVLVELHEVSIRTFLQAVQVLLDSSPGYQRPTPPAAESALPHILQVVDRGIKQGMSPDGPQQHPICYQLAGNMGYSGYNPLAQLAKHSLAQLVVYPSRMLTS